MAQSSIKLHNDLHKIESLVRVAHRITDENNRGESRFVDIGTIAKFTIGKTDLLEADILNLSEGLKEDTK
jgi:hypothetical protein